MNDKFRSLLGFARKSGNLIIGFDNIRKKSSKALLLVSASDPSERTKKNIESLGFGCPIIRTDMNKRELGNIIGCSSVAVVAVIDENFAKQLKLQAEKERE